MKVTIGDRELVVAAGTSIIDLIEGDKYQYQAARVNNELNH